MSELMWARVVLHESDLQSRDFDVAVTLTMSFAEALTGLREDFGEELEREDREISDDDLVSWLAGLGVRVSIQQVSVPV